MKIWQLVDGRSLGGIERHVAILVEALLDRRFSAEVVLWERYPQSVWRRQLIAGGVPFRELDGTFGSLLVALRRERPDLLHTHGYKANLVGRLAARLLAIPVVSTFHSGEPGRFPVSAYLGADRLLSFLGCRIAVSAEIGRRLPYGARVVRNFLMVPEHPPTLPLPRRVGFIGRLSEEKGPDLFCEIAGGGATDIEWHIWGDGPMRSELEARHGRRIVFHGATLNVGEALDRIGLLLMPSRAEGLPMAALEALAAGVPVLASDVGGLPDLIEHGKTGWLFEAGNIVQAREAIAAWLALSEPSAAAMRLACHAHARQRYSADTVLPELLEVYGAAGLEIGRTITTTASRGVHASLR